MIYLIANAQLLIKAQLHHLDAAQSERNSHGGHHTVAELTKLDQRSCSIIRPNTKQISLRNILQRRKPDWQLFRGLRELFLLPLFAYTLFIPQLCLHKTRHDSVDADLLSCQIGCETSCEREHGAVKSTAYSGIGTRFDGRHAGG
jgi:hypothetical protein